MSSTSTICSLCKVCHRNATSIGLCSALTDGVICTCNAGFVGNGTNCDICPAGTYQSGLSCVSCPAYSSSSPGAFSRGSCACNTGFFGDLNSTTSICSLCKVCHRNATTTGECLGTIDNVVCTCNAGFVGTGLVADSGCTLCLPGTYKKGSKCLSCPRYSSSLQAAGIVCVCNAGFTGPDGGACTACESGKYKMMAGNSTCKPCPINTISPSASILPAQCTCSPGFTGQPGACTECPGGFFGPGGASSCSQCMSCSPNATQSGICTAATGPIDPISCQCNDGFYGNGQICTDQKLPLPQLISIHPTVAFCIKTNQVLRVTLMNFPVFRATDLKVSILQKGKNSVTLEAAAVSISIIGDLLGSNSTVNITLPTQRNEDSGIFTIVMALKIGESTQTVPFDLFFKLYIVGSPIVNKFYPQTFWQGQAITLFLQASNMIPLQAARTDTISVAGSFLASSLITISDSKLSATNIIISLGSTIRAGKYATQVCSSDTNLNSACSDPITFVVNIPPAPTVLNGSMFPKSSPAGPTTGKTQVQFMIQYLNPWSNISQIAVQMVTEGGLAVMLDVKLIVSLSATTCSESYCALHQISVFLPKLGNPDGQNKSSSCSLRIYLDSALVGSLAFKYVGTDLPVVSYVSSTSVVLPVSNEIIIVLITNFPEGNCDRQSCSSSLLGLNVSFGLFPAIVSDFRFTQGYLKVSLSVPASNMAQSVLVTIRAVSNTTMTSSTVSFDFSYVAPLALVSPVDGTSLGGSLVQLSAVGWGPISNSIHVASQVFVTFGDYSATEVSILQAWSNASYSVVTVLVTTPPNVYNVTGTLQGFFGIVDTSVKSTFQWQYYAAPVVLGSVPPNATVGGFTGSEDGNTIKLTVQGFPPVKLLSDVAVIFEILDTGASIDSSVVAFENFAGFVSLTVIVPALSIDLECTASISLQCARPGYETREAIFSDFAYYLPVTSLQIVRWCKSCRPGAASCIVSGFCGNADGIQQKPLISAAGLMESGSLSVALNNVHLSQGNLNTEGYSLEFGQFQNNSSVSRLATISSVYGDYATAVLEFFLPALSSADCKLQLRLHSTVILSFLGFDCLDRSIYIICKENSTQRDTVCGGPSSQTSGSLFAFTARIYGLKSSKVKMDVSFGGVPAFLSYVSVFGAGYLDLVVIPPEYDTFDGGSETVSMIISTKDRSTTVSAPFTFWKAPSVASVIFDKMGIKILVQFDQDTNRGGMYTSSSDCNQLFDLDTVMSFGKGNMCFWTSSQQLIVVLGAAATVQVNGGLNFLGGRLMSANGLSPFADSFIAYVESPPVLSIPFIQVMGPSTIDSCSALTLYASGVSPRPLSFSWWCSNDKDLNDYLQNLPPASSLQLAAGTPQLLSLDKVYIFSVVATDFLGSVSNPATIEVLKKSAAVPQFIFSPPSFSISRSQSLVISGKAAFSACPVSRDAMSFSWSQKSGPQLGNKVYQIISSASSPQIFLPAGSLQAGAQYIFAVKLQVGSDRTAYSESAVTVNVGLQPVLAVISGGSSFQFSVMSDWSLDASRSLDLDKAELPLDHQGLIYSWSCTLFDGAMNNPCTDLNGTILKFGSESFLMLKSYTLSPSYDEPYMISVTVQDSARQKLRNTATVPVYVKESFVLSVTLELDSSVRMRGQDTVINSNEKTNSKENATCPVTYLNICKCCNK